MTQAKFVKKTSRNQYTPEFRQQALAERIGVAKAARELGMHDSQLYPGAVNNVSRAPPLSVSSNRQQKSPASSANWPSGMRNWPFSKRRPRSSPDA